VPAVCLASLDGVEVALHQPLIAQGAQLGKLTSTHDGTGNTEFPEARVAGQLVVESEQFTPLVAHGVTVRTEDDGQFYRHQRAFTVADKEAA